MKGVALRCGALLVVGCVVAARAVVAEVAVTDADRVFRNFTREAATVKSGQIRLELRGFTLDDDENTRLDLLGFPVKEIEDEVGTEVRRVQGGIIDLLGSYGLGPTAEVGFDVPFFFQKTRLRDQPNINDQDVGDVLLYGKFKRMVATHCAVAGGLELTVPTGIEDKRFGTGEVGVNPFVASRYQRGRFALGAHAGYQIFTGEVDDVFNYSVEVLARGGPHYALRAEVAGRVFKTGGADFHDAVLLPGIDFNLSENVTVRPTGLANLTDEALDWGLGVGIAVQL